MNISAMCIRCLLDRQEERIRKFEDERKKAAYLKEVAAIIASSEADASAPYLVYRINAVYKKYFGMLPDYEEEKRFFNHLMLQLEPDLEKDIYAAEDEEEILKHALNYARSANYIDYGATNHVEKEQLLELIRKAKDESLDAKTLEYFREDLSKAKEILYLADNCGEIVADKVLIRVLKKFYPHANITVMVRGMAVLNDVTLEDAKAVGLTEIVRVIENGNGVAGTQINLLSDEARQLLGMADVIISKGQGNFETIHGCGLNIYYLFLCKCEWFTKRFGMERLKGVFVNEKDVSLT